MACIVNGRITMAKLADMAEKALDETRMLILCAPSLAAGLAGASLVVFFGLWFGLTLALRTRDHASRSVLRVSRAAR